MQFLQSFQVISSREDIPPTGGWVDVPEFKSKGTFVNWFGRKVSTVDSEMCYQIIAKRTRNFSIRERFLRGLGGVIRVVFSLGIFLLFKDIRNLFTKQKESIRYGIINVDTYSFVDCKGETVYVRPKILFLGTKISENEKLTFALINRNHVETVTAIVSSDHYKTCKLYDGSVCEALLRIAQKQEDSNLGALLAIPDKSAFDIQKSPVQILLNWENGSVLKREEFFRFISEKDGNGVPRICSLDEKNTIDLLKIAQEEKIPIDVLCKTPDGETLFTRWIKKGRFEPVELIFETDSSVIDHIQDIYSLVEAAYLMDDKYTIRNAGEWLLNRLEERNHLVSNEEMWIQRARKNDAHFSDEEFTKLGQDLKRIVYFVANAQGHEDLVERLRTLGMSTSPRFFPGPSQIVAPTMDIIVAQEAVKCFLKKLRKDGCLLTKDEGAALDESIYIKKPGQLGRIQGRDFVEKVAAESGLKHIKVPKKILVFHSNDTSIKVRTSKDGEIFVGEEKYDIYAEKIEQVNRKISLEEGIELMLSLEKTGFNDFAGENILIAKDGIYFIDTEFHNFSPRNPRFNNISALVKSLLRVEDVEKFLEALEKRKANFVAPVNEWNDPSMEKFSHLLCGYGDRCFTFSFAYDT